MDRLRPKGSSLRTRRDGTGRAWRTVRQHAQDQHAAREVGIQVTEVIVTALAGLAVAAALWGMARHQLYLYRVNRRLRGIAKIRRR